MNKKHTQEKAAAFLISSGYMEFKDHMFDSDRNKYADIGYTFKKRCFQRRLIDQDNVCITNGRLSINVFLEELKFNNDEARPPSITAQMEIVGEVMGNSWVKLSFYGLSMKQLIENINDLEQRLINSWDAIYYN